jgi:hypothetical protein
MGTLLPNQPPVEDNKRAKDCPSQKSMKPLCKYLEGGISMPGTTRINLVRIFLVPNLLFGFRNIESP